MKIAVCISGKANFFEKSFNYLKKNLIDNFKEVDIFFHCWDNNISDENKRKILNLYKPKKFIFEKEKIHILNYPFEQSKTLPNNAFSMFYSIMKANELKKKNELENNLKYDWVFRIRFDFALNCFFENATLSLLDNSYVYLNNFEESPNPHCADCFGFSSSVNMDVYSGTYNNIMKYGLEGVILAGEAMLYKQIIENNIKLKVFDVKHPFPPDNLTCFCKHSLIRQ